MIYYVDIDGTLTDNPKKQWGKPRIKNINKVKKIIDDPKNIVVIWSSGGWGYAMLFCVKYDLNPDFILPKPDYIIDDIPTIRSKGRITYLNPEQI